MKRHFTKIAIALICLGLVSTYIISAYKGYKNRNGKNIEMPEVKFTKEGTLSILDADGNSIKDLEIEVAKTPYETQTGLMYRKTMEENRGMLFMFPRESVHSFYMRNTLIPLDILYINKNLEIVSFAKNAKPMDETSLPSGKAVQYALEVNGGMMDKWGVEVGDKISFKED
ncbi:hypothetical protein SAMN05216480_102118 [Pustulibacterium marinum]|uniref:DUF192 domain-containing protein n=1 Tax=Pustulibacterium marinum TaxID=1224947 RepID=A0A1I7FQ71_9FLAO|nr:DUF192 domain-containing protein [Pustulibacterium marinum]SFU38352.1 hypothetical protein SAMN05216480_102118 [Pustulibacterium marinum]